jgi:hypothetical protein
MPPPKTNRGGKNPGQDRLVLHAGAEELEVSLDAHGHAVVGVESGDALGRRRGG